MPGRTSRPVTVACAQIEVSDDIALACEKIADAMSEAAGRGARLVIFPECAIGGYYPNEWREGARAMCWKAIDAALDCLRRLCRRHRLSVVAGAPRRTGGRILNSAFAIGGDGKVLAVYDKIHLTGMRSGRDDAGFFSRGRSLPVFRAEGIAVGMQICMDFRFPEPYRILRGKGARLVCQPTCVAGRSGLWKSGILQAHIASRAAENEFFVALCNSAGPFQNMPSQIVGPDGDVLARAPLDEETVIYAEIDPLRRPRMDILGSLAEDLYAIEWRGD
ncbi:MAG: carbon-nitrogen hydrolase family protein [Planctomycetota bacterium]|nr:carbon-nitrogen hydrolase family protein [Planctomycetota bacterium]